MAKEPTSSSARKRKSAPAQSQPGPSVSKKRKVIKSKETVDSGEEVSEDDMEVAERMSGSETWPAHRGSFVEFEAYYGKFSRLFLFV